MFTNWYETIFAVTMSYLFLQAPKVPRVGYSETSLSYFSQERTHYGGTTGFGTGLGTRAGHWIHGRMRNPHWEEAWEPVVRVPAQVKSLSTSTTSSTATVPSTLFSLGGKQRY